MTEVLWLVIRMVGGLLATACILRALAYRFRLSPHNPLNVFVNAVTDWLIKPLRRILPLTRTMDWASLVGAVILALLSGAFYMLLRGYDPMPAQVLLIALGLLIGWTLYLMIGLLILQAVLSWVNPHAPIAPAINQLTDPFLAPIRKVIPLVGNVDLSPMVLMLVVYVLLAVAQSLLGPYML